MTNLTFSCVPGSRGSGFPLWEKTILSTGYWVYSSKVLSIPGMLKSGKAKKITWLGTAKSAM